MVGHARVVHAGRKVAPVMAPVGTLHGKGPGWGLGEGRSLNFCGFEVRIFEETKLNVFYVLLRQPREGVGALFLSFAFFLCQVTV
jgi:hypothetical protein